ncbi:MAG: VCBS repeat-containing protein, partial [Gemmataceae bacterium]|nr:VCBS repeat-containing protein [Gemmataceae bacterium]
MDLDGDGQLDLLSGSWPGELFLFRGGPGRSFAAPVMLKDKDGNIINIGGGIREEPNGRILITGNAEFEQTPEGTFVNYHGKRIQSTAEKPIAVTGTASAVHAVDWDGDGRLDLLVGDIRGQVYLIPNEGTAKAYAFGKERQLQAGGKLLRVDGGDAGPFAADWDGDGRLDLLVGAGDGSVWFYRNVGNAKAPELAAGVRLIPPGEASFGADAPKQPRRGMRAKVCAVDWNSDGRLDLLVGDFSTQKPDLPEPTPEQKAEHDKLRRQLESVMGRYRELVTKLHGA